MDISSILNINNNAFWLCGGKESVTCGQLTKDINRFAVYFNQINAQTVILYVPNNFYLFCVSFFALLVAQKDVVLPGMLTKQNASLYATLTNTIITDSADDFDGFVKVFPGAPDTDEICDWNGEFDNQNIYFFTSGSTGCPKCIKKNMRMLIGEVEYHVRMHANQIADLPVVVASIAPHHMYGILWRVLFPLFAGIPVDMDMIFTPEELIEKQSLYKYILFMTTPSFLDGITRYGGQYNFPENCIGIFTSGSLLGTKTAELAYKMFGTSPFEIFGSTETGGIAFRQQKHNENWCIFDGVSVSIKNGKTEINSSYSFQNPYLMADAIEMIDDKHFKLLGRADRIVKIAEERISLPEMEKHLGDNEYISRAYCSVMHKGVRNIIACMIEPTAQGAERIIKVGRRVFFDELKKYLSGFVPAVALPKCIRVVNQIPTNSQGKFVKNEILSMFDSSVIEPIMQNVARTDTDVVADLTFTGDSAYFKGHFPGFPILPGVIQMHFVFHFIKQFFHTTVTAFDVVKLKYSSLILPDVKTHFELAKLNENEFSFCYFQNDKVCSSGRIIIRGKINV